MTFTSSLNLSREIGSYVEACLQLKRIFNANDNEKAIPSNAKEGLKRIGKESEINRRRVSSYVIEIDVT
ncbi:MAG: hypothetical protein ACI955_000714 [Zhongshania sp.]|jgi:hypothetical protein